MFSTSSRRMLRIASLVLLCAAATGFFCQAQENSADGQDPPTYEALVNAVLARDGALSALLISEERARIALERASIAKRAPSFSAGLDSTRLVFGENGFSFQSSPFFSTGFYPGLSAALSMPSSFADSAWNFTPGLELGFPILRGTDRALTALESAKAASVEAATARFARRIAAEKELVAAIKAVYSADIAVQSAHATEARAYRELERAKRIDGAQPGGIAYRRLERDIRSAARTLRDAESTLAAALADLGAISGLDFAARGLRGLPAAYPAVDMDRPLPKAEQSPDMLAAQTSQRAREIETIQSRRRNKIDGTVGLNYSTARGQESPEAGWGVSTGIRAVLENLDIGLSAQYADKTPSLSLSFAWKAPPPRDRKLRLRDEALEDRLAALKAQELLHEARRKVARLAADRPRLAAQSADAAWELDLAKEQAEAYAQWREKGLVTDIELKEIEYTVTECEARRRAAALDCLLWELDIRALTGEHE